MKDDVGETSPRSPSFAPYQGRKVLITGGLGFIGSNLAQRLVELGSRVTIIDALIPDQGGNLYNIQDIAGDVQLHVADLRCQEITDRLVRSQEIIFNLAAQISHGLGMANPHQDLELNCHSHLSLLEACRYHNPEAMIVYTGTRSQYGRPLYLPVDENHPQQPTDINGVHKAAAEAYHFIYHRVYGIPVCSLRLTNTYGPRQPMKDSRHGFINWFIRLALDGQCLTVYGDGQQRRDFNYVDDVVDALLGAGLAPDAIGEAFNLGSRQSISVLELARLVTALSDSGSYELVPFPETASKIEVGDYYADYRKISRTLAWEPQVLLEDGLKHTLAFLAKAREHYW